MSLISNEDQLVRTQTIMDLLISWNLSAKDQINLLGLPSSTKERHMQRYQQGDVLPQSGDVNERIDHLFGIGDALRTSYPHNELMGALWLTTKHRRFNNEAPLQVMLGQNLPGILSVRAHLDCAFDWRVDDENQKPK